MWSNGTLGLRWWLCSKRRPRSLAGWSSGILWAASATTMYYKYQFNYITLNVCMDSLNMCISVSLLQILHDDGSSNLRRITAVNGRAKADKKKWTIWKIEKERSRKKEKTLKIPLRFFFLSACVCLCVVCGLTRVCLKLGLTSTLWKNRASSSLWAVTRDGCQDSLYA